MAYGILVGTKLFDTLTELDSHKVTYKLLETFARFKFFRNVQSYPYKQCMKITIWKGIP